MSVVRITTDGIQAKVFSPFSAKDLIKSMPQREWNPREKCWVIPARDLDAMKAVLEEDGYKVIVTGSQQNHRQQRQESPPNGGRRTGGSWAEAMFADLGPDLGEKAYKQLIRALHPDAGGSNQAMQVLNQARDRYRRAS